MAELETRRAGDPACIWVSFSAVILCWIVLTGCSHTRGHGVGSLAPVERDRLAAALREGSTAAKPDGAPDPLTVELPAPPPGGVSAWRAVPLSKVATFLDATAAMASSDVSARTSACEALNGPAQSRPVLDAARTALNAAPEGPQRDALMNDVAAKVRLSGACREASDPGWLVVAFTHPVAARVVLGLLS